MLEHEVIPSQSVFQVVKNNRISQKCIVHTVAVLLCRGEARIVHRDGQWDAYESITGVESQRKGKGFMF